MKRIILIVLVIALSLPALAQKSTGLFEKLTDKYADKDGFSASQISSEMFDLYLKKRNIDEASPVFDALKKLDNILVVSQSSITGVQYSRDVYSSSTNSTGETESNKTDYTKEIHKEILNYYKSSNYTLLKTEKRMGEDVKVYINKPNDKINSLALITSSSVSTNLVELKGDIDLKTVSELNQALNLRGLENLYKIDNSGSSLFGYSEGRRQYYDQERIEEMVARQREVAERHAELTEEQQAQIEQKARQMAEKQMQMAEKYREMAEQYGRQPIFLSSPGDTNTVYYLDGEKVKADKIKELNPDKIESVEVSKSEKMNNKTAIRIKTK